MLKKETEILEHLEDLEKRLNKDDGKNFDEVNYYIENMSRLIIIVISLNIRNIDVIKKIKSLLSKISRKYKLFSNEDFKKINGILSFKL